MSDSGSNSYAAFLAALSTMPEVKGAYFNHKEFKIDGYKFIGCRFDNCKLHLASANFEFHNCIIDPSTFIIYGNEIVPIMRLYNSRFDWAYTSMPFFAPKRNVDGTITIKKD